MAFPYEYNQDEDQTDQEAPQQPPSSGVSGALSSIPSMVPAGALSGLFPKQELPEIPPSPVDPKRKWRSFAAASLKGGTLAENLSNAWGAYNEQENKDAELFQRYLPLALDARAKRQQAQTAGMLQQQKMLTDWNSALLSSTAPLLTQPGATTPQNVAQIVSGLVRTGRIPPQIGQGFMETIPKDNDSLEKFLRNAALSAKDPYRAIQNPTIKGVKKDETLVAVNPEGTEAKPLIEGKMEPTDTLMKFMSEAKIDPNSPQGQQLIQQYGQKITTHQPANQQSVTIKEEQAEAKKVGEFHGEQYATLQKGAMEAQKKLASLNRMRQLLVGYGTGKFTPVLKDFANAAQDLGFKIDPNLGAKEGVESLTNQMAMEARNPSGGAGMPGAMSDSDRVFLRDTVPGLTKSPRGNQLIMETMRRLARRDIEVAQLAVKYRTEHGQIDTGFQSYLQQWSDNNPMFADLNGVKAPPAAGNVDDLVRRSKSGGK